MLAQELGSPTTFAVTDMSSVALPTEADAVIIAPDITVAARSLHSPPVWKSRRCTATLFVEAQLVGTL